MTHILGKGYYAFIEVGQWLRSADMADSAELGEYLARDWGVAIVPGAYFSRFGKWVRFSTLPCRPQHWRIRAFDCRIKGAQIVSSQEAHGCDSIVDR